MLDGKYGEEMVQDQNPSGKNCGGFGQKAIL